MNLLIAFFAFLIVLFASCDDVKFEYCLKNPGLKINAIDVSPIKPKPNSKVAVVTKGVALNETFILTYGYVNVEISLAGIRVKTYQYYVCGHVDPPCPLLPGKVTLSLSQEVPAYVLPGKYKFTVSAFDQNDEKQSCVYFYINVV